jgi:hypothetical protein
MTTRENLSSRRGLGAFAALIGAALMIISVFLPWFEGAGSSYSGWDAVVEDVTNIGVPGTSSQPILHRRLQSVLHRLTVLTPGSCSRCRLLMLSLFGGAFRMPGFWFIVGLLAQDAIVG